MWLALSVVVGLAARDPREVAAAVASIEASAAATGADELAAARACEDRLADPGRALALYQRVLRDHPDDRAAVAAARREAALRAQLGASAQFAQPASELAQLIASADSLPAGEVERRGDALTARAWPGASDAALFVASWLARADRCDAARPRFEAIAARSPPQAGASIAALRGAATCAITVGDWDDAEALAARLASDDPGEQLVSADLATAARIGRRREHAGELAWSTLALVVALLVGALARATALARARGAAGGWRARLRPPIEAVWMAPVVALLIIGTAVAQPDYVAAIAEIALAGLALAWVSGAGLAARAAAGRSLRVAAVAHIALCLLAVLAVAYLALANAGLLDLVIDTARFGFD